ncbi:hypothetical protein LTR53_016162 [Teratosphaeriaceae sp. CCFEE 6253]|nr:hypothetical protein LTR53_016162 [Teratosphaeriaceae sp. CCFEE 6253]
MVPIQASLTYLERLQTFQGYWDDNEATARQLAAIGHVYDRPPLEALEEGSRCISCSQFTQREWSIRALEGPLVRIPLEAEAVFPGLLGGHSVSEARARWEQRISHASPPPMAQPTRTRPQSSPFFRLPTELRLQIYEMVLPKLDEATEITTLNGDSSRIVTRCAHRKKAPRDPTMVNILSTCQAIHGEALDLLYTNRTYVFINCKVLYLFLRHIGAHGRALLSDITLVCGSREDAITFSLLASCHNLRRMYIISTRARLLTPSAPIWLVDGLAALLTLRALDDVEFVQDGHFDKTADRAMATSKNDGADATALERELMLSTGKQGRVRWSDGYMVF